MRVIPKLNENKKLIIKNKIKNIIEKKNEIIFAYVHGSFMLDIPFHDVDVAVFLHDHYLKDIITLDYEIQLSIELELVLKLPIDVKTINNKPLSFQYNVTKGKVLFCKEKQVLYNFIEITWMKYLDYKFYLDEAFKYLFHIG
ncbi:MAG: nucleotidyltransferase domain-containing protein [Candidatus Helarchaeota archaeon]|nr:nucleotidyltransferase domain-containing protein [Candidatus Helarchaeota archaeon]